MYLNHPEFDITAEDDIEEAMEKMELRAAYIEQVKSEIMKRKKAEEEAAMKSEAKKSGEEEANKVS